MDAWMKKTLGGGLFALVALVAMYGDKFWQAAGGAVNFMVLLADKAPLGVGSFALSIALATFAQAFFAPFVRLKCAPSTQLVLSAIGLVIGLGAMTLQLRTLNGVLLGLMAGFASPFVYQLLAAAWGLALRASPESDP